MDQIIYTKANAKEVAKAIDLIRPVVAGLDANVISMSCLAIAILMQRPEIDMTHLIDCIKDTSEHIALFLMGSDSGSVN